MEEEWISKSLPRLYSNGSPNPTGGCKQTILLKRGRINRGGDLLGEKTRILGLYRRYQEVGASGAGLKSMQL
jgi:hypothetical protein